MNKIIFTNLTVSNRHRLKSGHNYSNYNDFKELFCLLVDTSDGVYKNYLNVSYGPQPLDKDFKWENLNHHYYKEIRNDMRIKHFYNNKSYGLNDYIEMKEFLRDLFQHGISSKSYLNSNLIEMLDAAERGEKFLCTDISKMLAQMILASGSQARLVSLSTLEGKGHTVLEYWSETFDKWVLLDSDYNVYYTDLDSIPLNGLELYNFSKKNEKVLKHKGKSINTLFNSNTKLYEQMYRYGVAIDFYNKWVSKNYNRANPERSPVNSNIYVGEQKIRKIYYANDFDLENKKIVNLILRSPNK